MANIEIIKGADNGNPPDTLRQMYPKVNRNFTGLNDQVVQHISDNTVHVTQADHEKINGIESGAQVNQNAFSRVNGMNAGSPTDGFTIIGDVGIDVTQNPNDKTIHLTVTGKSAPGPHASTHLTGGSDPIPVATETTSGLMSPSSIKTINDLVHVPRAQYTSNVTKPAPPSTWVSPSWNQKVTDTDNFMIPGDDEAMYINKSGLYLIQVLVTFATNQYGARNLRIIKNASASIGYVSSVPVGPYAHRVNVSAIQFFNAGENVKIQAYQDTGSDLDILGGSETTIFNIVRLCPP